MLHTILYIGISLNIQFTNNLRLTNMQQVLYGEIDLFYYTCVHNNKKQRHKQSTNKVIK